MLFLSWAVDSKPLFVENAQTSWELGGTGEVNTLSKGRSVDSVLVLNLLVSEAKYPNSSMCI